MLHDDKCRRAIGRNRNMLVPWYLMASYMYYQRDKPILTDGLFDELCGQLLAEWHLVKHMHKRSIARADVRAGSCLLAEGAYPSMAVGAALRLAEEAKPARVRLEKPASTRVRLDPKPARVRLI